MLSNIKLNKYLPCIVFVSHPYVIYPHPLLAQHRKGCVFLGNIFDFLWWLTENAIQRPSIIVWKVEEKWG